ncbi:MAG: MerR family transcriptional regulator [Spirochaetales bacterium]|nr:MerR family transcriptional regulator [Spirochaetales bacterium]
MKLAAKDLAKKLDISLDTLTDWRVMKLISSFDTEGELYTEDAFREGETIKKFISMGYELEEILKIKKDVGLPAKENIKSQGIISGMLTVGELADAGGVNTRTIKFWEEKGLIKPFQRTDGGFRLYQIRDVDRVNFIKDLQSCNYTLAEIGNILKLMGKDVLSHEPLKEMNQQELEKLQSGLEYLIERMKETRHATSRVESLFAKRLKLVLKLTRSDNN